MLEDTNFIETSSTETLAGAAISQQERPVSGAFAWDLPCVGEAY